MKKLSYPVFFVPTNRELFERVIHLWTDGTVISIGKRRMDRLYKLYTLLLKDKVEWNSRGVEFVREFIDDYRDADENIIRKDLNLLVKLRFVMRAERDPEMDPFSIVRDIVQSTDGETPGFDLKKAFKELEKGKPITFGFQ